MTDREFIKVLKSSIRPDDAPVLISKETLSDIIYIIERQQETINDLAAGQERLQTYIKKLKEEANAKRRGN